MHTVDRPRGLVVFDIDGTLTATNAVDDECYQRAVGETLSIDPKTIDWTGSPHVTDSAIAHWLWSQHRGSPPGADHLEQLRVRFVTLLEEQLSSAPQRFVPIAGAAGLFAHLREAGWSVALATGGWGVSAQLKLRAAGLWSADVPLACSDDALSREEIVRLAFQRAEARAGTRFERIVSVGDGPWDVRTARALELPFVGVGTGARAERLRAAGASTLLPDLQRWDDVLAALELATVPNAGAIAAGP
jgi:phosphoglycolate phosphatase-like HAD superfamily hydrolase